MKGCVYKFEPGVVTSGAAAAWTSPSPVKVLNAGPHGDESASGFFTLQVAFTGSGAATFSYQITLDEAAPKSYVTPEGATSIMASKTVGGYAASFSPPPCVDFNVLIQNLGGALTFTKCKVIAL